LHRPWRGGFSGVNPRAVRIYEGSELRAYAVTGDGVVALPCNLPRLIHEGNWSALIASPLNIVTSVVLLGLLSTGVLLWARRNSGGGEEYSGAANVPRCVRRPEFPVAVGAVAAVCP